MKDSALYVFNIVLASKDNGATNQTTEFRCECVSYLDALEECCAYCRHERLAVVLIEEDYAAEMD